VGINPSGLFSFKEESVEQEQYFLTNDCAKFLKRSPGAIRNLVLRRAIPFRKPGGRLMFLKSEIELWIEKSPGIRLEDLGGEINENQK